MKLLYRFIAIMVVALLTSCSTTEKFLVSGTPNTKIYTPEYTHVGTIGSDGTAKIELTSNHYYAFLLSKDATSDTYIPFALDYKYNSHAGASFLKYIGMGTAFAGLIPMLSGTIALAAGDDDIGDTMLGIGSIATLTGVAIGMPADSRSQQTSYEYQFQYLNNQSTNSDLHFTKVAFTEPHKNAEQVSRHDVSTPTIVEETSVSRKQLTEKSTKTLKNYGKQVANTYVGTGKLTQNKMTIESYSNIKVKIEYVNKDEVRVNVTESNGSDFFTNYSLYKVEKKKNGSYLLTHSKIASATITIDANGNLKYNHPKVNIDGEVYNLQITTYK